jgi:hypothetical protein
VDIPPRPTLGHGGVLGILLALPVVAMTLVGMGHALGPHPVARTGAAPATLVDDTASSCFRPPPGAPARVARGYRFLWDFAGAYGDHARETTWVYNRSCSDPDANYPLLVIRVTNDGGHPSAADRRRGRPVDVNGSHATAVYYRRWMPHLLHTLLCTGGYWFPDERVRCRWDADTVNLLLVDAGHDTYAIIGGRTNGIGEIELLAVASRLPV